MAFSSGKGVVREPRGQQLDFALHRAHDSKSSYESSLAGTTAPSCSLEKEKEIEIQPNND